MNVIRRFFLSVTWGNIYVCTRSQILIQIDGALRDSVTNQSPTWWDAASCSPTLPCPDINHHQGPCFEKLPVDHNALTRPIYPAVNLTFRPLSRQGRLGWEYNGPAGQVAREWGHSEGFCPTPRIACTRWLHGPSCHRCQSQGHATHLFIGRGLCASICIYTRKGKYQKILCYFGVLPLLPSQFLGHKYILTMLLINFSGYQTLLMDILLITMITNAI